MDSAGVEVNNCHETKSSVFVDSKRDGVDKGEEKEEDGETNSLLRPVSNGGLAAKRQKSSRRKVQWNDRNGNKLVEVLEFQPSDSSDSEDDSSHGTSIWEHAIVGCAQVFCCLGDLWARS
ncbi:uncharacterized protein [Elaeis guineensis]|uniref:Uncharacterized protein LOC105055746 n=1 Tax=Elaeis guineensis var. tenera TaxID=51953 RepID=A0A6I9S1F8_ELAGV|nr:uncharacterized protein LOC105055746 [Elaeis guineensis]